MKDSNSDIFYYLISNKDFRDWVLVPGSQRNEFWQNWLFQHPEHTNALLQAREFIQRMEFKQHQLDEDELNGMLGQIIAADDREGDFLAMQEKAEPSFLAHPLLKVAAVLLIIISSVFLINTVVQEEDGHYALAEETDWNFSENPKGQKSKIKLADGTIVNLSHESSLRFPKKFSPEIREVELIGEAFFEVEKDEMRPFVVKSNGIETKVLGTSFNIRANVFEDDLAISLVTGKVKINSDDLDKKEEIFLEAGQEFRLDRKSGNTHVGSFNVEQVTAWKEGVLLFKNSSMEAFIDKLERWYGVDFQVYGKFPKNWEINGRYRNEKLEDVLIGIQFVYGIEYYINGKSVTLKINS